VVFPNSEQVTLCEVLAGQQILVRCTEVSDNHGVLIHVKNSAECSTTTCAKECVPQFMNA
jgi:hypothetical protein